MLAACVRDEASSLPMIALTWYNRLVAEPARQELQHVALSCGQSLTYQAVCHSPRDGNADVPRSGKQRADACHELIDRAAEEEIAVHATLHCHTNFLLPLVGRDDEDLRAPESRGRRTSLLGSQVQAIEIVGQDDISVGMPRVRGLDAAHSNIQVGLLAQRRRHAESKQRLAVLDEHVDTAQRWFIHD